MPKKLSLKPRSSNDAPHKRNTEIMILGCHNKLKEARKCSRQCQKRNVVAEFAMIDGYVKVGRLDDARKEALHLFHQMPERNVVAWTTMVSGLAQNKIVGTARKYFDLMPYKDISAWIAMITACVGEGFMDEARKLFDQMPKKNVGTTNVSWTVMIVANSNRGLGHHALQAEHYSCLEDILGRTRLVDEAMDVMSIIPPSERDEVVLVTLLGACRLHRDLF
ncbi:Pentatricopeptide repeat-containing protein, mitochondrial, partial [Mucuna pruriens]